MKYGIPPYINVNWPWEECPKYIEYLKNNSWRALEYRYASLRKELSATEHSKDFMLVMSDGWGEDKETMAMFSSDKPFAWKFLPHKATLTLATLSVAEMDQLTFIDDYPKGITLTELRAKVAAKPREKRYVVDEKKPDPAIVILDETIDKLRSTKSLMSQALSEKH
jgi:hypothetical protein